MLVGGAEQNYGNFVDVDLSAGEQLVVPQQGTATVTITLTVESIIPAYKKKKKKNASPETVRHFFFRWTPDGRRRGWAACLGVPVLPPFCCCSAGQTQIRATVRCGAAAMPIA